jgi:hypothetical protein
LRLNAFRDSRNARAIYQYYSTNSSAAFHPQAVDRLAHLESRQTVAAAVCSLDQDWKA